MVFAPSKMRLETVRNFWLLRPSFPPPFLVYCDPSESLLLSLYRSITTDPRALTGILVLSLAAPGVTGYG